jgi:hypothetical protein
LFEYIYYIPTAKELQMLAAEQLLPGQAVQSSLPNFHHGTNHVCHPSPPAKLGRTPIRAGSLVFWPQ